MSGGAPQWTRTGPRCGNPSPTRCPKVWRSCAADIACDGLSSMTGRRGWRRHSKASASDQSPRWRSWRTTRPSISRRSSRRTSSGPVPSTSTSATEPEELAEVLEDSESEVLVFHGSLAAQVAEARDDVPSATRRHTDRRWVTIARWSAPLRGSDRDPWSGAPDTPIR